MSRKPRKGYFVRGQFVAEGSELDEQFKQELRSGGPSKTELKAQSTELQALGEQLPGLRADLLAPLGLPERLLTALDQLQRIADFEGRRRQGQYVGKLMRQLPSETIAAIRAALDDQRRGAAHEVLRLHAAEDWRTRLVAGDEAVQSWAAQFPAADLQKLRTLVRQARKDAPAPAQERESQARGQAPRQGRAWRDLFQLIQAELALAEREALNPAEQSGYGDDTRAG